MSIIVACLFMIARTVIASCECGFTVNTTTSDSFAFFTQAQETDFLHVKNLTLLPDWQPQEYSQGHQAANGPFGRLFTTQNVMTNPLADIYNWGGDGVHGGDPGLQLWVNSTLAPGPNDDPSIYCSEIVTRRDDILYGSFRIGLKTTPINGTCSAFFYYRDDTSEIDMEFLSKQQLPGNSSVNLVIQSPENGALGYTAPGSVDFDHHELVASPSSDYNEYRFDWLPDRVDFYANNKLLRTMTENVPQTPGRLHISHWSNGNLGWSGGPPASDSVLTVSFVKAYFNSSNDNITQHFAQTCPDSPRSACLIPEPTDSPNPISPDGNITGHTPFLTNSTTGNSTTETSFAVRSVHMLHDAMMLGFLIAVGSLIL